MIIKLLRIAAIFICMVLLILGSVLFAIRLYVGSKWARYNNENMLRGIFSREVRIGEMYMTMTGSLGAKNVVVSEYPDMRRGRFLSLAAIELKQKYLPLLENKFVVSEVNIIRPNIRIVKTGTAFNISDLTGLTNKIARHRDHKHRKYLPMAAAFNKVNIVDGEVDYYTADTGSYDLKFSSVNIKFVNVTNDRPFIITGVFELSSPRESANFVFSGVYDHQKREVLIENSQIDINSQKIRFSAKLALKDEAALDYAFEFSGNDNSVDLLLNLFLRDKQYVLDSRKPNKIKLAGTAKLD